jgi:CBS domain containing-hemolysin-like protein
MQTQVREEARRSSRAAALAGAAAALLVPGAAEASFLSGEALDTAANVLSWVVIVIVPIVVIAIFGYVHVLPEIIAEKRHHPQKHAIKTLCILSLFFGGLLWPLAWLWAYTRPVMFRSAYGSERHEDYYREMGEKARLGQLVRADLVRLRMELAAMAEQGKLPPELHDVRRSIEEAAERVERAEEQPALEGSPR